MAELVGTLVILAVLCLLAAILYRNRVSVSKWLKVPYSPEDDRKLKLQRRIEDAQIELEALEKNEAEDKGEE